jgi:hypothetical protein
VSSDSASEWGVFVDMPDTAQVAFAFFSHVAGKDQSCRQQHAGLDQGMRQTQHSDNPRGIVTRTRGLNALVLDDRLERRSFGKDCVEMGGQKNYRACGNRILRPWKHAEDVSDFVGRTGFQPCPAKLFAYPIRTGILTKRRCWNCDKFGLPSQHLPIVQVQPAKGLMEWPLLSNPGHP